MTLPNGDSLHDMRALRNPAPYTTYDIDIYENFGKVETNIGLIYNTVQFLQQADVAVAADAVNNIQNLLCNGSFNLAMCAPYDETGATGAVIPTENPAGIKQVRWADCWFFEEDDPDALDVQSIDIDNPPSAGQWLNPESGIRVKRGGGSGAHTGTVFQRLDLFLDMANVRGKMLTLGVHYTALTAGEFYLEIDDGVTASDNSTVSPSPSPAGEGISRLTHLVDAAATKLTVKIVVQTDAPVDDDDALVIHQAYLRAGVSPVQIPVGTPPEQVGRDMDIARQFSRYLIWGDSNGAIAFGLAGTKDTTFNIEHATTEVVFESPLINDGANTQIGTLYVTAFSANPSDPRDITSLAVAPVVSLVGARPTMVNRMPGDTIAETGYYTGAHLLMYRSPLLVGSDGFVADDLRVGISVIPDP